MGWRLIGANNRELGRSAAVFESMELCRAAVVRLREGVGAGQVRGLFAMSDTAGTWTWRLELGGHQAAMSGRTYQRQREAQHNLTLFLAAVPLAQLTAEMPVRPRLRGLQLPRPAEGRDAAGSTRADLEGDTVRMPAAGPRTPAVRS